jgi:hypothetical protein
VCEHKGSVGQVEDIELEHVAPELNCELERSKCVLGRESGRATVADAREVTVRTA